MLQIGNPIIDRCSRQHEDLLTLSYVKHFPVVRLPRVWIDALNTSIPKVMSFINYDNVCTLANTFQIRLGFAAQEVRMVEYLELAVLTKDMRQILPQSTFPNCLPCCLRNKKGDVQSVMQH